LENIIINSLRLTMHVLSFILLVKAIKNYKVTYPINIFIWVIALSVMDTLIFIFVSKILRDNILFLEIAKYYQSFYQLVECVVIFIYFLLILKNALLRFIIKIFIIFLLLFFSISSIYGKNIFEENFLFIIIIQILIINICSCLIFINDIEGSNPELKESHVILAKGIFIFINFTSPYYIISKYLEENLFSVSIYLNVISDIGYIIFFNSLLKSYKCYQKV
jgi:hypothetical protein